MDPQRTLVEARIRRNNAPRIEPSQIRYIELGRGGGWVDLSLDRGELHSGFSEVPHDIARTGNVDEIRAIYLAQGRASGVATSFARELLQFYEQPRTTLWITFARDRLWWCFAEREVIPLTTFPATGARMRRTVDGWHHRDRCGDDLRTETLSSRLTKTAAFRATICKIDSRDYLLRRTNGDGDPGVSALRTAQNELRHSLAKLIRQLHWRDFEILVDLVFARLGWQRISTLGETMPDFDIVLEQPITGERGVVQVKSAAGKEELDRFSEAARAIGAARAWFVVHSMQAPPAEGDQRIELWSVEHVARAVEKAGLLDWLVDRLR